MAKVPENDRRGCLRATFHRVVPPIDDAEYLEQIVPYIGGDGGGAGRRFSIRAGITGQAVRDRQPYTMERKSEDYEDYKRELVSEWHYTDGDVRSITSDRFSAMAIPVKARNGQDIVGVIYLDSKTRKFFAQESVRIATLGACAGVVNYIGERYA